MAPPTAAVGKRSLQAPRRLSSWCGPHTHISYTKTCRWPGLQKPRGKGWPQAEQDGAPAGSEWPQGLRVVAGWAAQLKAEAQSGREGVSQWVPCQQIPKVWAGSHKAGLLRAPWEPVSVSRCVQALLGGGKLKMSSPGGRGTGGSVFSHSLHLQQLLFLTQEDVWTEGVPSSLCPRGRPASLLPLGSLRLVRVEISSQEAQIGHTGDPKALWMRLLAEPASPQVRPNSSFTPF